ncbi:MAG: holdfast anchoring protein HfaA [Pseudomonadota bacterium]
MTRKTKFSYWAVSLGLSTLALSAGASAQEGLDAFQQPIGFGFGEQNQPANANTRDINGNRVVIDGQIIQGSDLSLLTGSNLGFALGGSTLGARSLFTGSGFAQNRTTVAGNQLNVITQGSNNIVVIDSTQINNGDQTVVLNGEIDLDE